MLTVITGPMFSGKTSRLISLIDSNIIAGLGTLIFKPSNDTRYNATNTIKTHSGRFSPAMSVDKNKPMDILTCLLDYENEQFSVDVVAIDEAQFFNNNALRQLVNHLLFIEKKRVIVAGLSMDFEGKSFGAMPYLLSIADEIISLKAVCSKCKKINTATRTHRTVNNKEQTFIGGAESYEARCFECWSE